MPDRRGAHLSAGTSSLPPPPLRPPPTTKTRRTRSNTKKSRRTGNVMVRGRLAAPSMRGHSIVIVETRSDSRCQSSHHWKALVCARVFSLTLSPSPEGRGKTSPSPFGRRVGMRESQERNQTGDSDSTSVPDMVCQIGLGLLHFNYGFPSCSFVSTL